MHGIRYAGVHAETHEAMYDIWWFPTKDNPFPSRQAKSTMTRVFLEEFETASTLYETDQTAINWFSGAASDVCTAQRVSHHDDSGSENDVCELIGSADTGCKPGSAHTEITYNSVRAGGVVVASHAGWRQEKDACCALNSLANAAIHLGVPLLCEAYASLKCSHGELHTLREVVGELQGMKGRTICATVVPVERCELLAHLLGLTEGVFAVESFGHCTTIDCAKRLIINTDPRHPNALNLDRWYRRLGINQGEINVAYRITRACREKPRTKK